MSSFADLASQLPQFMKLRQGNLQQRKILIPAAMPKACKRPIPSTSSKTIMSTAVQAIEAKAQVVERCKPGGWRGGFLGRLERSDAGAIVGQAIIHTANGAFHRPTSRIAPRPADCIATNPSIVSRLCEGRHRFFLHARIAA